MPCTMTVPPGAASRTCTATCATAVSTVASLSSFYVANLILQACSMQIPQSPRTAQWVKWARSTSRAMAASPSVSPAAALLPLGVTWVLSAVALTSAHPAEPAGALLQVRKQQQTSRRWYPQHIRSRRRPSTSQSHERFATRQQYACRSCALMCKGSGEESSPSTGALVCGLQDVTLQNEGAWGALAAAQPSAAKDVAKPADGSAGAAGSGPNSSAPGEQDPLWSEFASREQQQRKREAEKAAEEEERRAEKAKVGHIVPLRLERQRSGLDACAL